MNGQRYIITAGSNYLDIDAYACCVAMRELLVLEGRTAVAYSAAPRNYSVCAQLVAEGQIETELPPSFSPKTSDYIIVDVSDPEYIRESAPPARVCAVYDHHTGFEAFWENRIGQNARIEFLGAAATLVRQSIGEYLKDGRDHLQVAFGCTGGQHRSVYFAERMAGRLAGIDGVEVEVSHVAKPHWRRGHTTATSV